MSECPHPTTRQSGVCQQCSIERKFESVEMDAAEHTCPTCGEPTARSEGECHRCRGAADECERCGNRKDQLTRVPVKDLDEMLTVCPDCQTHLQQRGRILTPIADGGEEHAEQSETLQALGRARMHVTQAITRSVEGEDAAVFQHLSTAARELRRIDLDNAAGLLEDLRDEDEPDYLVREDLRQLAQFFDAWAGSTVEDFAEQYQLQATGETPEVNAGP